MDGYSQGFRVVRAAGREDRKARKRYRTALSVIVLKSTPKLLKKKKISSRFFNHVSGTLENTGTRTLVEVEMMIFPLTLEGTPHLVDEEVYARPTWNLVYPVLTNSAHPGKAQAPLKPGESRTWSVDVPTAFDLPAEIDEWKWGVRITNLKFAER